MSYILDSNVFIQAKNLHYGFDFCPAFWDWLLEKNTKNIVYSIDKVADEIEEGTDELTDWVHNTAQNLFKKTDASVFPSLSTVSNSVIGKGYEQSAIHTFLQIADSFLVAHALSNNHIVVTHEIPANSPKRIKIPNVCADLNVRFMTPYEMLRREKARFVLGHV